MELGTLALLRAQAAHKLIKTLQAGIHWKGNVNTFADLPSTGLTELDAYTVLHGNTDHKAGLYAYQNNTWKFYLTCLELDQALSASSENAIANKAVYNAIENLKSLINSETSAREKAVSGEQEARELADADLNKTLNAAIESFTKAITDEASTRQSADASLQSQLDESEKTIEAEITKIYTELNNKSKVSVSSSAVAGASTAKSINVNGVDYNIPEGGSGGGVSQEYVDTQDKKVLSDTKLYTDEQDLAVWNKVTERFTSEEETRANADKILQDNIDGEALVRTNAVNAINAKIDVLEDTSATKNELANETKAREAQNIIPSTQKFKEAETAYGFQQGDKFYNFPEGEVGPTNFLATITKTEAGVITITDQDGTTTTFQTGGGTGGVSQEYVDTQDEATYNRSHDELVVVSGVVDTIAAQLEEEKSTRRTEDNYIKEDLITETNRAKAAEEALDKNKQSTISDLNTIRSNASKGATAVQPSDISDMATKTWVRQQGYLTEHQSLSAYRTAEEQDQIDRNKEDSSNKSNTIVESNTKYPTCNAVIEYIAQLNGDDDEF